MTNKFEQLIEYVINDEEAKAKELFHDIVVEKSREIYENLMNEEEEDLDEAKEEDEELDEAAEEDGEELDENFGGDAADDLIHDVETEEEGMQEGEEEFDGEEEFGGEEESGEDLEDRVVDLEDKLDELMAEFESLMGDEAGEEHGEEEIDVDLDAGEGGDALSMDDTEEFTDSPEMMEEGIELTKVAPAKMGDDGANTKSPVAANSGAAGMASKPVTTTGGEAKGRPAPSVGSISNEKFQNTPASGSKKLSPATKPTLSQASGVNTKTPFPKG
jgi:hypothetical protein